MDAALYTSHWVLSKTLSMAYYTVFGVEKNPLMQRLDHIESQLEALDTHSLNTEWYEKHHENLPDRKWIVISREEHVYTSETKSDALMWIAVREKSDPMHKCLLLRVGDESSMVEI